MKTLTFNYATRQGRKVDLTISTKGIEVFQAKWTTFVFGRYGTRLVDPNVHAVVSSDGTKITDSHLLAGGILE